MTDVTTDPLERLRAARPTADRLAVDLPRSAQDRILAGIAGSAATSPDVTASAARRGRRWLLLGAVAAAGAGALAVGPAIVATPPAQASPLERLSEIAARTDTVIPVGRYLHRTQTYWQLDRDSETGQIAGPPTQGTSESWIRWDGRLWRRDSNPSGTTVFTFGEAGRWAPAQVADVPTEPDALADWLLASAEAGDDPGGPMPDAGGSRTDAVFQALGELLGTGYTTPGTNRAAFELLDSLPGIAVSPAPTPDGRPGVRAQLRFPSGGTHYYVFDAATADLTEDGGTDADGVVQNESRFTPGTVGDIPQEILDTAITDAQWAARQGEREAAGSSPGAVTRPTTPPRG